MLVKIGSYDLCDGTLAGGVAIGQARVQMDRVFDVVVPLDELNPELFDRTCRKCSFTFTIQRVHADAATAEVFVMDIDSDVPSSGTVTLTPTNSGSFRYIPNGFVTNHQSSLLGATSTTTYTIVGGQPTSSAP